MNKNKILFNLLEAKNELLLGIEASSFSDLSDEDILIYKTIIEDISFKLQLFKDINNDSSKSIIYIIKHLIGE